MLLFAEAQLRATDYFKTEIHLIVIFIIGLQGA